MQIKEKEKELAQEELQNSVEVTPIETQPLESMNTTGLVSFLSCIIEFKGSHLSDRV